MQNSIEENPESPPSLVTRKSERKTSS